MLSFGRWTVTKGGQISGDGVQQAIHINFHMAEIVLILITKDADPFDIIDGLGTRQTHRHLVVLIVFMHGTMAGNGGYQ